MDQSEYGSRIVYPRMPEPLRESDLAGLFTVSPEEDQGWLLSRHVVRRLGPDLWFEFPIRGRGLCAEAYWRPK
jgi:hypothetical protein